MRCILNPVVRQLQSQISTVHIQQNRPIAAFSISTFDSSFIWWFPEEFDTNGDVLFVPIVKVIDWPCDLNTDIPCHEDTGGLAYDEWSLDNDLRLTWSMVTSLLRTWPRPQFVPARRRP